MTYTFTKDPETGYKVESNASVKRRVAEVTGFQYSKIVLLEAGYMRINLNNASVCKYVSFRVNGRGMWTDFLQWGFDSAYDEI